MRISNRGLLEICEHEGVVPGPYIDSVGVWTYGVGHTAAAGDPRPDRMRRGMPDDLTNEMWSVFDVFRRDVEKYENRVSDAINVPLKQHEFDALVSFDFNTGGIHRAKLTARINKGDPLAHRSFLGWLKPASITKRRTAEMNLFTSGDYDASGTDIAVWNVDADGKLLGVGSNLSTDRALEMMGAGPDPTKIHPQSDIVDRGLGTHIGQDSSCDFFATLITTLKTLWKGTRNG